MIIYLDGKHERVVAVLQELDDEFLQTQPDAERGSAVDFGLLDGGQVLGLLAILLVQVQRQALDIALRLVVDEVLVADRFHVQDNVRSTKPGVSKKIFDLKMFLGFLQNMAA